MPGLTLLAGLPVPTRTRTNGHHMDRAWRWVTNISFPRSNDSLMELFLFVNVPYVLEVYQRPDDPDCLPVCVDESSKYLISRKLAPDPVEARAAHAPRLRVRAQRTATLFMMAY
jgi:hypothetical protein